VVAAGAEDDAVIDGDARGQDFPQRGPFDFGQLVYAADTRRHPSSNARANLSTMVSDFVAEHGEKLAARFVVVQPG